jgi:hypothetical protein
MMSSNPRNLFCVASWKEKKKKKKSEVAKHFPLRSTGAPNAKKVSRGV